MNTDGVSIGSSFGSAATNLYMNYFEPSTFLLLGKLLLIFLHSGTGTSTIFLHIRLGEDGLLIFLRFLNDKVSAIKFMEKGIDKGIAFLDLSISTVCLVLPRSFMGW